MLVNTASICLLNALCISWFGFISCDVVVDIVCVVPLSGFPLTKYESIVQDVSSSRLASPTVLRADLITGAAARDMYFPGSMTILRFQLLHITRAHSLLKLNGKDPAVTVRALLDGLLNATASDVGMCGIDDISDGSSGLSITSVGRSWLLDLPALVAPVALIGWIVTSFFCGGCWLYYIFYIPSSNVPVPSADVVQPEIAVVQGVPLAPTLPPPPSVPRGVVQQPKIDIDNGSGPNYSAVQNDRRPAYRESGQVRPEVSRTSGLRMADSEMKTFPLPTNVHTSIEFHHPNHQIIPRFLDMRIPSFDDRSAKVFSSQTSSLGVFAA